MSTNLKIDKKRALRFAGPVLVTTAVATVVWVSAGDINPPPGAIQPTNRVQLNEQAIALPHTISQSGSYVLTSNLVGSSGLDGIIIDADDVTLDLNGFALLGVAGSLDGVQSNSALRNLSIYNGTVRGWDGDGVDAAGSANSQFENLRVSDNGGNGIIAGPGSVVTGCTLTGNVGAGIQASSNGHVLKNTCTDNGAGVRAASDGNRIEANHVAGNDVGIDVDGADNLIIKNSARDNTTDYDIVAGNSFGPIAVVGGIGDMTAVASANHPWANFSLVCAPVTWCHDFDGDGYGDPADTAEACTPPMGYVSDCTDCDDANALIFPGQMLYADCDGDSYYRGASFTVCQWPVSPCADLALPDGGWTDLDPGPNADCDDEDVGVHPGAAEMPDDGIDQDCNGADTITCIIDNDQDGYGTDAGTTILADDGSCDTSQGESSNASDCDDTMPDVYPGAPEIPDDSIDQDCNGVDTITCVVDADHDGYGTNAGTPVLANDGSCDTAQGESTNAGDCDDSDPSVRPGALEVVADGVDQDCDGADDCYQDLDDDTYGTATVIGDNNLDCSDASTPNTASMSGDCDDSMPSIYPGAAEVPADGMDQDCDGVDDCYQDLDGDNWGSSVVIPDNNLLCTDASTPNTAGMSGDCDDSNTTVYPGAPEVCDGLDNNCNTVTDEGVCPNGTSCVNPTICASGNCVDGVCCNSSCTGTCVACTTAKTGRPDGRCDVVSAGTDPDGECAGASTCDGYGSCTVCGDGATEGLEVCDDGYNDLCGSCNADCSGVGSGSVCGDGAVCPESEVCDDGYTDACGSCNAICSGVGSGSVCGDGVVCPESEVCDTLGDVGCTWPLDTCNSCTLCEL